MNKINQARLFLSPDPAANRTQVEAAHRDLSGKEHPGRALPSLLWVQGCLDAHAVPDYPSFSKCSK